MIDPALATLTQNREICVHISVPRSERAALNFHLEASDGLGYLEQDGADHLGIIYVPPPFLDDVLDWLEAMPPEINVKIRSIKTW